MKLKLIAVALIVLLAITVAPTVVAANGAAHLQTIVVRPVYAVIPGQVWGWTLGPQVGSVVYNTQTGFFMLVASGLAPLTNGNQYYLGTSTVPPPSTFNIFPMDTVSVNSLGRTLAFGQTHINTVTTIDNAIANGDVFVVFEH
jgi:hypothetical protein